MRKPVVLITGAGGEIGHGLVTRLAASGSSIVTLDLAPLDRALAPLVAREFIGSITDTNVLERLLAEFEVDCVFHLAALLSTRAEFTPMAAHQVNVEGTLNLLEFAQKQGESHGRPVVFVYPSSIAAHGLPDLETKARAGRVREDDYTHPTTMYGCNKLYCEQLGRYYARHYKQLSADAVRRVDFRCVRFPGLISAVTTAVRRHVGLRAGDDPRGGARRAVRLFRPPGHDDSVHGDAGRRGRAADAGVGAARAPDADGIQCQRVQSVRAAEIRDVVLKAFPDATITFKVDDKRQGIVDSWPADVDDSAARRDWGFSPAYDFDRAFREYLIPTIRQRYRHD